MESLKNNNTLKMVVPRKVIPSHLAVCDLPRNKISMMTVLSTSRVRPATEPDVKKNSSDMDRLYPHHFPGASNRRLQSFHFRVEGRVARRNMKPRRGPLHFWDACTDDLPQLLWTFKL